MALWDKKALPGSALATGNSLVVAGHVFASPGLFIYYLATLILRRNKAGIILFVVASTVLATINYLVLSLFIPFFLVTFFLFIPTGFFTGVIHYFFILALRKAEGLPDRTVITASAATILIVVTSLIMLQYNPYTPLDKECRRHPNLECMKASLAESIQYPDQEKENWKLVMALAKVGLLEAAKEVANQTDTPLSSFNFRTLIGHVVVHEAKHNPEGEYLEKIIDEWSGYLEKDKETGEPVINRLGLYSVLTSKLSGYYGGGGSSHFVNVMERAQKSDFEDNTTRKVFFDLWVDEIKKLPNTKKTAAQLGMASHLMLVGKSKEGRQLYRDVASSIVEPDRNLLNGLTRAGMYELATEISRETKQEVGTLWNIVARLIKKNNIKVARNYAEKLHNVIDLKNFSTGERAVMNYAEMFSTVGMKEQALYLAERYNKQKLPKDINKVNSIKLYRLAGRKDKAQEIADNINLSSKAECYKSDKINGLLAPELFMIDLFDKAEIKFSEICSESRRVEAWLKIYEYAFKNNLEDKVFTPEWRTSTHNTDALFRLASFYLDQGSNDKANKTIEKYTKIAEHARNTSQVCDMALLAKRIQREDLVDQLLEKSIEVLHAKNYTRVKEPNYFRFANILSTKIKLKPRESNYNRYMRYLYIVGCFNQITPTAKM